jgi:hypothetical protein
MGVERAAEDQVCMAGAGGGDVGEGADGFGLQV